MDEKITVPHPENQPGATGRPPEGLSTGPCRNKSFTDRQFWDETPDEIAAEAWFIKAFWPTSKVIRCPRCAWNEPGKPSGPTAGLPYRCPRCRKTFSVTTETVMLRSRLSLREWKHALFIWTGGTRQCSSKELAQRMGVDDGTAHAVTLRILEAAKEEELPPLREPAELSWFKLGGKPANQHTDKRNPAASLDSTAIAMVGRHSGKTFIGNMDHPDQESIRRFVRKHLAPGMDLYLSNHSLHQDIPGVKLHKIADPESSYLLLELKNRVLTVLDAVHNGVSQKHLARYLAGLQWWENHGHLCHRERMNVLARGMRWKTPPSSNPERPNGSGAGQRQKTGSPRGTRARHHATVRVNGRRHKSPPDTPTKPSTRPLPLHDD